MERTEKDLQTWNFIRYVNDSGSQSHSFCRLYVFDTKQVVQPVLDSSFKNSLQDNGESTHFDADTFDIVQYSYVLHEMPMENAHALLSEAYRILKPGGVLSGFEGM